MLLFCMRSMGALWNTASDYEKKRNDENNPLSVILLFYFTFMSHDGNFSTEFAVMIYSRTIELLFWINSHSKFLSSKILMCLCSHPAWLYNYNDFINSTSQFYVVIWIHFSQLYLRVSLIFRHSWWWIAGKLLGVCVHWWLNSKMVLCGKCVLHFDGKFWEIFPGISLSLKTELNGLAFNFWVFKFKLELSLKWSNFSRNFWNSRKDCGLIKKSNAKFVQKKLYKLIQPISNDNNSKKCIFKHYQ